MIGEAIGLQASDNLTSSTTGSFKWVMTTAMEPVQYPGPPSSD